MAKIVLVTGCSTGIGLATAVALAKDAATEYKVYATMRNLSKKDALVNAAGATLDKNLLIRKLDVVSDSDVEEVVGEILKNEQRIDYVINNAGRGFLGTLEGSPISAVQQIIDTNLVGVIRVCKAVIPTMKQQNAGYIINVSSGAGSIGIPFNGVYCASKFGLEGFSESLAPELLMFNCYISVVEPGPVATNFTQNVISLRADQEMDKHRSDPKTDALVAKMQETIMKSVSSKGQTSEEVADIIIKSMKEDKPKFRISTHPMVDHLLGMRYHDGTGDNLIEYIRKAYLS